MKIRSFNPNWIGLGILVIAFGFSILRYRAIRAQLSLGTEGGTVVRVLHWQLEPGYREGLKWAMDEYNQLPHVREAGVRVIQLAIPERVYAQFLNVHLISGTAPDICVQGMSSMVGGSAATARFFEPISQFVQGPNPYNQGDFLKSGLSEELAEFLQTTAWADTFSDGMAAGWSQENQDYFAVPVSSWGTTKVYYNQRLVADIKAWMAREWDSENPLAWKVRSLEEEKRVADDADLQAWLHSPESPPDTLGRFLLFCEAARFYAEEHQLRNLVPISGSNYIPGQFYSAYELPFTAPIAWKVNIDHDHSISSTEIFGGWQAGLWTFNDPGFKAYFEVAASFSRNFPAGFMGLDREQAQRRFILGNAVFIATGAWDANSIFLGAKQKANPEDAFDVGVMPFPMPAPGERWHEAYAGRPSGAGANLGVPMALNKQSANKEWAVDFLRYLTSHRVNERFNQIASWLPAIHGAEPVEEMKPFQHDLSGLPYGSMHLKGGGQLTTLLQGQFLLFFGGELSFSGFVEQAAELFKSERFGANRVWHDQAVAARDRSRQLDRSLDVRMIEDDALTGDNLGASRRLFESSLLSRDGQIPLIQHQLLLPDNDFPRF